jgi:guanylate kinase
LNKAGLCLVLAAPSGAGKTTISRALLATDDRLSLSISATTRAPRPGEVDGEHYHFVDQTRFDEMIAAGDLLEYARVFGRSYGTPRAPVQAALAQGNDILFDIDWQGYRQVKTALPGQTIGIFIAPPDLPTLEARLRARGDTPAQITARMEQAQAEMSHAGEFDHIVTNIDLPQALAETRRILQAARQGR